MLLSVQRRRSNGITVQGNYTWSHCIADFFAAGGSQTSTGVLSWPSWNERAGCLGDTRHSYQFVTVYETPQFSSSALRIVGQRLAGVRHRPYSVRAVTSRLRRASIRHWELDSASTGQTRYWPILISPTRAVNGWLNPAAFARPANGVWGNASQNIQGPGVITINMGLTRSFRVTGKTDRAVPGRGVQFAEPYESE